MYIFIVLGCWLGNANSVTVPLELDSDSDFNPREFVTEEKKRTSTKRKRKSGHANTERRKMSTVSDADESDAESEGAFDSEFSDMSGADEGNPSSIRKRKLPRNRDPKRVKGKDWGPCPLRAYFASIHESSASELESEEEELVTSRSRQRTRPKADSTEEEDDNPLLSPAISFSPKASRSTIRPAGDGSSTDSSVATIVFPSDEDLATDSDTSEELLFDDDGAPSLLDEDTSDSDEDVEEFELMIDPRARPDFPLPKGQEWLNSHILSSPGTLPAISIPPSLNTFLRSYQREGIEFIYRQYSQDMGGVLGDDMGLGKTVQVIGFLSAIMSKTGTRRDANRRHKHVSELQDGKIWKKHGKLPAANETWPTALIIAPSTIVWNWQREFRTWGYFEVGLYMGKKEERERVLKDFVLGRLDVVVTSHDLARMDIELLDTLSWSVIFIDEAHKVKNPNSKITRAYHHFTCLRRFGLTGTAIDWANPDSLGTKRDWKNLINLPLTKGQSSNASRDGRRQFLETSNVLTHKILPNFFLRRTKHLIADQMPKKYDQIYKRIVGHPRVVNIIRRREKCECGRQLDRQYFFYFMSILIKLSNHLCLILPGDPHDSKEQLPVNYVRNFAFPPQSAALLPDYCGKWRALRLLLTEWSKDKIAKNKVLIFTKSVKLIGALSRNHYSYSGFKHLTLDGSTKQEDRMPLIDQFQQDEQVFIFLISTLAGGTGLNLTGANKVVIFDPNWNPAHDLQAMDRAFRFGQRRDVHVYRLLAAGSIEELIYARQVYKQQQMAIGYDASIQTRYFEGVQDDPTQQGELFGLNNIFKLDEEKLQTKMVVERAMSQEKREGKNKEGIDDDGKEELAIGRAIDTKADNELHGLGALLFDDAPPPIKRKAATQGVHVELGDSTGVKYTHFNDQMLVPSAKELREAEELKSKKRKRRSKVVSISGSSKTKSKTVHALVAEDDEDESALSPSERFQRRLAAAALMGTETFEDPDQAEDFVRYL
ncbi:P-loop containing nucleoside triphosphate hydrolase protein [Flagelloscypha sp. PMI_526]|nr:P-loop containing nucleoside triphosphate hydrolase protein [Flagelloscypha sp. PMI_526]